MSNDERAHLTASARFGGRGRRDGLHRLPYRPSIFRDLRCFILSLRSDPSKQTLNRWHERMVLALLFPVVVTAGFYSTAYWAQIEKSAWDRWHASKDLRSSGKAVAALFGVLWGVLAFALTFPPWAFVWWLLIAAADAVR